MKRYTAQELAAMPEEIGHKEERDLRRQKLLPWYFNDKILTLELFIDGQHKYQIDLERCNNSAQILDWIFQVACKRWATNEVLGDLVRAFDFAFREVFGSSAQGKVCGSGVNREIKWR